MTTIPTEERLLVGLGTIANKAFDPPISIPSLRSLLRKNNVKWITVGRQIAIYSSSLKDQLEKNI